MKRRVWLIAVLGGFAGGALAFAAAMLVAGLTFVLAPAPAPTPTPPFSPTSAAPPTPPPTATATRTPAPTLTPTATPTPTPTFTPIPPPTPTPEVRSQSLTVRPGGTAAETVDLARARRIEGTIAVEGGNGDIQFQVAANDGTAVQQPVRVVKQLSFNWAVDRPVPWTFHFDNTFSLFTSKRVVIQYRVWR